MVNKYIDKYLSNISSDIFISTQGCHEVAGAGTSGDVGCHHDFLMACVLQNIRNAWLVLNATDPLSYSFEDMMKDLAYEL